MMKQKSCIGLTEAKLMKSMTKQIMVWKLRANVTGTNLVRDLKSNF